MSTRAQASLSTEDDERDRLPMWAVYDHPADFPDSYVARKWLTLPKVSATDEKIICSSLDDIRDEMEARGLVCLMRNPQDDPCIVETWL
jgi:hypothetical protein